jgi:hypothetical protein
LLSERAYQIYSFSHLSFQEYFTARNIIETTDNNSIQKLIRKYLFDDRWHEIILLTASMLNRGDKLIQEIINVTNNLIQKDIACRNLFRWIDEKSAFSSKHYSKTRVLFLLLLIAQSLLYLYNTIRNLQLDFTKNAPLIERLKFDQAILMKAWHLCREVYAQLPSTEGPQAVKERQALRILDLLVESLTGKKHKIVDFDIDSAASDHVLEFTRTLGIAFSSSDLERLQKMSVNQAEIISKYAQAMKLLIECLDMVVIENRSDIFDKLFFVS